MPKGWSAQQEAHLRQLSKDEKVPFRKESGKPIAPTVIKKIYNDQPIFQTGGYSLKNFKAAEWLCSVTKSGGRKKAPSAGESKEAATEDAADGAEADGDAEVESGEEAEESEDSETGEAEAEEAEEEDDDDSKPLADLFKKKMTITEAVTTFKLPVLVYEYTDENGFTFVTADVLLLSGTCKADLKVTMHSGGTLVSIEQKWPETFLAWQRIILEDEERNKESPTTKPAALTKAATKVRSKCKKGDDNRPIMTFQFKLPIPCKTIFANKPFICSYQNDYKAQTRKNNNYLVLHLDFNAVKEPVEARSNVKEAAKVLRSPLSKAMDDSDSDEDHGADEARGRRSGNRDGEDQNMAEDAGGGVNF